MASRRHERSATRGPGTQTHVCQAFTSTGHPAVRVISRRANHICEPGSEWLWGSPSRRAEPWTIFIARIGATHLTRRTAIKQAWF